MGGSRPIRILLADDDEDDRALTRDALRDAYANSDLSTVGDGAEVLDYLRSRDRPDLILLDLKMPRMDGHEVLAAIKGDPALRSIPVIVLTSSRDAKDIASTYDLGASSYVTKPSGYADLVDVMRSVSDYWMGIVNLPPPPSRDG
jgi:CheY-like chemotaxis protein